MGLVTDQKTPFKICPRCGRHVHFPDANCPMNFVDPVGHTKVEPAQQVRGTGRCQVCERCDQDCLIVRVPGGQKEGSDGARMREKGYRMSETMMYMCNGCAHKLFIQLMEFLAL